MRSRQRINAWRMLTCGIPTMIGPASDSGMRSLSMLRHREESSRSYRSTDRLRYANMDELKQYGANLTFSRFHAGSYRCCELSDAGSFNYTTTSRTNTHEDFPISALVTIMSCALWSQESGSNACMAPLMADGPYHVRKSNVPSQRLVSQGYMSSAWSHRPKVSSQVNFMAAQQANDSS